MCHRSSPSRLIFPSLFGLIIFSSSTTSASWTKDLADKAGAFLDSTLQMGQGMSGGGKPFGEAAAQILRNPVGSRACKGTGNDIQEVATFAAGCFWSVELSFQRVPGVLSTRVGYIGGHTPNPTYQDVCTGTTGHAEAVEIKFDPSIVSYPELLTVLWDRHDPTQKDRQGNDRGTQYRSAIFYHSLAQKEQAEASIKEDEKHRLSPIVTQVVPATTFYEAEEYHQQYLQKGGQCARKQDLTPIRCYG
ncbi:peptide-methionine-s-oxide reductase [Nannochloropsis oceanica]